MTESRKIEERVHRRERIWERGKFNKKSLVYYSEEIKTFITLVIYSYFVNANVTVTTSNKIIREVLI